MNGVEVRGSVVVHVQVDLRVMILVVNSGNLLIQVNVMVQNLEIQVNLKVLETLDLPSPLNPLDLNLRGLHVHIPNPLDRPDQLLHLPRLNLQSPLMTTKEVKAADLLGHQVPSLQVLNAPIRMNLTNAMEMQV